MSERGAARGWSSRLRWVPGLAIVVGMAWWAITHGAQERQLAEILEQSRPLWLVAAAGLQLCSYVSAAEAIRVPLAAGGAAPRRSALVRLAVLKVTMDQLVPTGGMSGTLLVLRRLRALGVPPAVAGSAFVIEAVGFYLAYALAVGLAVVVLWFHHDLSPWLASGATLFAVASTALPLAMLGLVLRRGRLVPPWMTRFGWVRALVSETTVVSLPLLGRTDAYVKSGLASLATIAIDAMTLSMTLLAVGVEPELLDAFTAVVLGSVAATVGLVPGGLGTFEAAAVGTLVLLGIGSIEALGATLLLRMFTFWFPMVLALFIYRRDRPRSVSPAQANPLMPKPLA